MKMINKKSVLGIFLYIGGYFEKQCSIYVDYNLYRKQKKKEKNTFNQHFSRSFMYCDTMVYSRTLGWSGGAMVLGKLPVPGRPTYLE